MPPSRTAWLITEGHAGMESQCRGLAEALGTAWTAKRVKVRAPWRWLPGQVWLAPLAAVDPAGDRLAPPWPDLVISCGRKSAPLALGIKAASRGATRAVHIQDPLIPTAPFDAVVVPRHDGVTGPRIIVTRAAVHGVTAAKLAAARTEFAPLLGHLPRPLAAVLIGGPNGRYTLDAPVMQGIADQLAALARAGIGLAITASRRTGAGNEAILRAALAGTGAWLWDGTGANPYLGMLAHADAVLVTADSVSMVSEAAATGRPVHVIPLPGGSRRFRAFHDSMEAQGITRPFRGRLEDWSYAPVDDTAAAAAEIRGRLGWSGS